MMDKVLSVRFPQDLIARMQELADQDGMRLSKWLRKLVARELAAPSPPFPMTITGWAGPVTANACAPNVIYTIEPGPHTSYTI